MRKNRKHLDFEVNLIPFIDLLSTCICFLLLTAVWVSVASIDVKQAVGGQPGDESAKKPTMWVLMKADGDLSFDIQNSRLPARLAKFTLQGQAGKPDVERISGIVEQLKAREPSLTTALIQPQAVSVYEDIIDLMDQFKKAGLADLGVAPL
ncbi:MAG TPA: biopolymer transporter ExbD [Bdellovibrionales bacterium]|nr:biopolymer transporter ExbD [Bdellovibrionales bacterium]